MRKISVPGLEPSECFIDDDDVVRLITRGQYTKDSSLLVNLAINQASAILRSEKKPVYVLSDTSEVTRITPDGMKSTFKGADTFDLDAYAVVGNKNGYVTKIVNMVLKMTGERKVKYCSSIEDAKKWFREGDFSKK